jgi:hypothetical protein
VVVQAVELGWKGMACLPRVVGVGEGEEGMFAKTGKEKLECGVC